MINLKKLREEQLRLAKKVIIKDSFGKLGLIAGCDQAFINNTIISAIVVLDYKTMQIIEKKYSVIKAKISYIPGFLSYREGPAIIEAFNKLEKRPSVLMLDCNGILHPLRIGMASHVGILLNQATIGVAKKLLCGKLSDNKVIVDNEVRAFTLKTREHTNPIYISPGHKISLKTSLKIVKNSLRYSHKLPEPLYLAHKYANKIKNELQGKNFF